MAETVEQDPEVVAAPAPKNGEETMSVNVKGKASDVVRRITGGDQKPTPPPEKKNDNSEAVIEALKIAKNVYVVKRVEPETFGNAKTRRDVHSGECPASLREITDFVQQNHGGRKYRIAVNDGETGKTIAADRFTVDADPILPVNPMDADLERILMVGNRRSAADMTADAIEKQTEVMLKQAELERAKQTLEDVRGKAKPDPSAGSAVEQRMAQLELKLVEEQYKSRVAVLEAQLAAKTQAAPQSDGTRDLIFKMLEDSKAERIASENRFTALMAKMQDDKMSAVLRELQSIKEKPAQAPNDMLAQVVALKKLMSALKGDDEEDDEEPKEWWELLIKEHLPRVFDLIEDKAKSGKSLTKEEIVAEMNAAADRAVRDFQPPTPTVQQRSAPLPLPAPAPAPLVQAPPPVGGGIPEPKVTAVAPAPAPALNLQPDAKPAPVPAPAPAPQQSIEMLSVEQEITLRAAKFMMVVEHEMSIRPKDYSWNAIAWEALPEDLLEKFEAVTLPDAIPAVFTGIMNPEKIASMSEQMKAPKVAAFMQRGLDELKGWLAASKEDPSFDPFEEEDAPEVVA